jgi:cytochrome c oxidase subunit 2
MADAAAGQGKFSSEKWLLPLIIWSFPVVTVALGLRTWLPPLASDHGAGIDRMLRYLLLSVGAIYVVGNAVLGYFVWRFSRQEQVSARLASKGAERRWSLIPAVIMMLVAEGGVFLLGLPVWGQYYSAPPDDTLTVELTAEQFAWNVRYTGADGRFGHISPQFITLNNPVGMDPNDAVGRDDIILLNDVHLPVNRPARIRLRSKDVIHSFFVPDFRVKQDAVPGMVIEVWFVPTQTGIFELACNQICGFGHYTMRGLVTVVTDAEFQQWLQEQSPI